MQKARIIAFCYFKSVACARRPDIECFQAKPVVVDRAGRRGEIVDKVYPAKIKRFANVVLLERVARLVFEVRYII